MNGDSRRADTINGAGVSRAINHLSIGSTSLKRAISVSIVLLLASPLLVYIITVLAQSYYINKKRPSKTRSQQNSIKSGGHWIRTSGYLTISAV